MLGKYRRMFNLEPKGFNGPMMKILKPIYTKIKNINYTIFKFSKKAGFILILIPLIDSILSLFRLDNEGNTAFILPMKFNALCLGFGIMFLIICLVTFIVNKITNFLIPYAKK